jgi:small subunit ribosomal protein S6
LAENVYEGMFILDANRCARDGAKVARQVEKMIETAGGELLVSRLWEERRLAYPIKRHRKGAYWLTYFRMEPTGLSGLNRQSQINDLVLRHLFLKIDPRIVDAMLSHVQAEEKPAEEAKQPAEAEEKKTAEAAAATPASDQVSTKEEATDAAAEAADVATESSEPTS